MTFDEMKQWTKIHLSEERLELYVQRYQEFEKHHVGFFLGLSIANDLSVFASFLENIRKGETRKAAIRGIILGIALSAYLRQLHEWLNDQDDDDHGGDDEPGDGGPDDGGLSKKVVMHLMQGFLERERVH